MLCLYFGPILENVWGPKRFFIFYMVCGLGAALTHETVIFFQYNHLVQSLSPENLQTVLNEGTAYFNQGKVFTDPDMQSLQILLNTPTVGASGAIFGVLLAFGVLFPNTQLMLLFPPIPIKAKYLVLGYGALELYPCCNTARKQYCTCCSSWRYAIRIYSYKILEKNNKYFILMGIWDDIKLTFRNGSNLTRLIYINIAVFILITIVAVIGFLLNNQEISGKALDLFSVPASFKCFAC